MTYAHRQHPLGTEFTPASTADDVIRGIGDLSDVNVVITGGHTGLGLVTTTTLAGAGASVTVGARNPDRAREALTDLPSVRVERLDLMDPTSVDTFARRFLDSGRALHILINNAGLPAPVEVVRDARGYEAQFATNHLGHFQLTRNLLPALRAARGARVVTVSSGAQRMGDIRWDDPHFSSGYEAGVAYAQSKTANVLFSVELDRRLSADGIRGYAVHPGVVVGTALNGSVGTEQLLAMGLIDESGAPIIDPASGRKTVQQGAATIVFAAVSPLLAGTGGVYLRDCDISPMADESVPIVFGPGHPITADVARHSVDPQSAQRLWELSEQLLAS